VRSPGLRSARASFSLVRRQILPLFRPLLSLLLVWGLVIGDLPSQWTEVHHTPDASRHLTQGLWNRLRDDLGSRLSLPTAQANGPTIYSISPDNVPAGQTVSISGANLGSSGTVTVAGAIQEERRSE